MKPLFLFHSLTSITCDSILQLAQWGEFTVTENFTIGEVISAINEGRMLEAFGARNHISPSPPISE